jgi:hypothetical protein
MPQENSKWLNYLIGPAQHAPSRSFPLELGRSSVRSNVDITISLNVICAATPILPPHCHHCGAPLVNKRKRYCGRVRCREERYAINHKRIKKPSIIDLA